MKKNKKTKDQQLAELRAKLKAVARLVDEWEGQMHPNLKLMIDAILRNE